MDEKIQTEVTSYSLDEKIQTEVSSYSLHFLQTSILFTQITFAMVTLY